MAMPPPAWRPGTAMVPACRDWSVPRLRCASRCWPPPGPTVPVAGPASGPRSGGGDPEGMVQALRRMAVVASDQTHRIRLAFEDGRVHLNVLTPDLGEGHDELELVYQGEDIEIGFNANYLLEVLRYMPTDEVKLTFKAPERAATLEPVAEDETAIDYLCLVMPLRLLD